VINARRDAKVPNFEEINAYLDRLKTHFRRKLQSPYVLAESSKIIPWCERFAWASSDYAVADPKESPTTGDHFFVVIRSMSGLDQFSVRFVCVAKKRKVIFDNSNDSGAFTADCAPIDLRETIPIPVRGSTSLSIDSRIRGAYLEIIEVASRFQEVPRGKAIGEEEGKVVFNFDR